MPVALVAVLWLLALAATLLASELLVRSVTALGAQVGMSLAVLGLLVAFGADSPEITSGLIAITQNQVNVGIGVVLGSNIYNLAGLLGISAIVGGSLSIGKRLLPREGAVNVLLTVGVIILLVTPVPQAVLAIAMLIIFGAYIAYTVVEKPASTGPEVRSQIEAEEASTGHPLPANIALTLVAVIVIVAASYGLVQASLNLGPRFGIPSSVIGTLVLAIATSLPNTYAAISLSRRDLPASAVSATFNSNSINLIAAIAVPALILTLHASNITRTLDVGWLALMTVAALFLLAVRHALSRRDGAMLIGLYVVFAALHIVFE
ncbi:MAG: sodium:calcium antiporter [Chloroflexota bacterium]